MDEMNTKELDRLADWLKSHGHSADEVLDCLAYIAGTQKPAEPDRNN